MEAPVQLSVIIVNYNVRHFLEQCLASVFRALEGLRGEVIVVDNHSSDDSLEMIRERFGDRVHLIANQDNPGFSKANNQGIAAASGTYLLLLNPDTLVPPDTFRRCIAFLDAHPDAGAMGVRMIDGTGTFLPESKRALPTPWVSFYKIFGLSALFPRSRRFGQYHLTYLDPKQNHAVEVLSGACMWLRKSLTDRIGGLDEAFFMYGEDIDLSYRVTLAGFRNYYLADAPILHYKGESTKKGSLNYVRVFYQAMIIFARKHFGGQRQRWFIAAVHLAVYVRAVAAILRRLALRAGFPLLEGGLIYALMYGIQAYWEHYVKYIEGGAYPPVFTQVYLPVYAAVFVGLLWLHGAYRKPYRLKPLAVAPFWGFIAIATATYMFPFVQNFSRAIVGLSAVFTMLIAIATRGLLSRKAQGRFFFTEENRRRVVIAGTPAEIRRAAGLIFGRLRYPAEVLGYVSEAPSAELPDLAWLGRPADLLAVGALYRADEWVLAFGAETGEALTLLERLHGSGMPGKILPPDSEFLIAPHTVIRPWSQAPDDAAALRRRLTGYKRWMDPLGSAALLLLFPLLAPALRRPASAWRGLWTVLRGQAHLVGYAQPAPAGLPRLRPGLLSLRDRRPDAPADLPLGPLDAQYAAAAGWELDLDIVLHGWRSLRAPEEGGAG
ncbi:MAG: glycosyltransferase [Bacteroidia bacterium]|nr:glycosyltransferase [Bacteroidia bacterium]